jgi:hypothetical protein
MGGEQHPGGVLDGGVVPVKPSCLEAFERLEQGIEH